jgi:hypothetical protein
MTQDFIEQNVRRTLGDLLLQNIMLMARIAELEAAAADAAEPMPPPKTARKEDHVNGQG